MIESCSFGEPVELYATGDRGWRCSSSSGMDSIRNFFRNSWTGFIRESRCGSTPATWVNIATFIVFPDSLQMHLIWSSKTRDLAGPNCYVWISSDFSFGNCSPLFYFRTKTGCCPSNFSRIFFLWSQTGTWKKIGPETLIFGIQSRHQNKPPPFFRFDWATEAGRFIPTTKF